MTFRVRGTLGAALTAAVCAGQAQEPPPAQLESITVTGTRLPAAAGAAPVSTVIDAAEIAVLNPQNVPELLAGLAGLHTNLPGSRGSVGELFLRGGEPNFTAVLIDGIQVNDSTNTRGGSFDFSTLSTGEIERIEILRGPLSSVYGSDALSGIVNVITHEPPAELEGRVSAAVGGEDFASLGARLGGPLVRDGGFVVNASTVRDGRGASPSGYRSAALSGRLEFARNDDSELALHGRHSTAALHAFPDSSGGPLFAVLREQDRRDTRDDTVGMRWRRAVSPRTDLHLTAAIFEHDETVDSPGVAGGVSTAIPASTTDTEFSRQALNLFLSTAINARLSTALGLSYERQRGHNEGFLMLAPELVVPTGYGLSRDDVAVFGELAYTPGQSLSLTAALRHDETEAAGGETTSKLGVSYTLPGTDVRLRLSSAAAFKLPSLFSLGHPIVGNPALVSETVRGWEAGVEIGGPGDRFGLQLTAFRQRFENLIDFDFEQFMSVNRDRVRTDGVEIAAHWRVADELTVSAHATCVDITVSGSDEGLRQRPKRRGGASIQWSPSPSLTLHLGWRYVGERLDESIPTGARTLPSYTRTDASLSWRLTPATALDVALDNLTDERYEDAIGFPSLGSRLRVGVRTALPPRP